MSGCVHTSWWSSSLSSSCRWCGRSDWWFHDSSCEHQTTRRWTCARARVRAWVCANRQFWTSTAPHRCRRGPTGTLAARKDASLWHLSPTQARGQRALEKPSGALRIVREKVCLRRGAVWPRETRRGAAAHVLAVLLEDVVQLRGRLELLLLAMPLVLVVECLALVRVCQLRELDAVLANLARGRRHVVVWLRAVPREHLLTQPLVLHGRKERVGCELRGCQGCGGLPGVAGLSGAWRRTSCTCEGALGGAKGWTVSVP